MPNLPDAVSVPGGLLNVSERIAPSPVVPSPVVPSPGELIPVAPAAASDVSADKAPIPLLEETNRRVRSALHKTMQRYPSLVNPTAGAAAQLRLFEGSEKEYRKDYTTAIDLKIEPDQIDIKRLAIAKFPQEKQLYWVLSGNRVVVETQGWLGTLDYQGKATDITIEEKFKATQVLWGLQAVWLMPQALQELVDDEALQNSSILSIAGEVFDPSGISNTALNLNLGSAGVGSPEAVQTRRDRKVASIGSASTFSSQGGGSLFQLIEPINAPKVLQAFPTTNLQVLLTGDGLVEGGRVSPDLLAKAGIQFGNPFTGEGFRFQPEVTSLPGIKVAQLDRFDNWELLNLLVNPYLSPNQKRAYYLNSLNWVSLGVRRPKLLSTTTVTAQQDWYQARLTYPHNRALLQYEKTPGRATYYGLFTNPGLALSLSLDAGEIHPQQSLNSSIGHLLGLGMGLIHPFRLEKSVWEAKLHRSRQEAFTPLRTKTSAEERQQINQRLERSLSLAQSNSGIVQTSGILTLPTAITPHSTDLFQIRTGNYRRRVQLAEVKQTTTASEIYISKFQLSDRTFGPLTTIGVPVPKFTTSIQPDQPTTINAVRSIVKDSQGNVLFDAENEVELTAVPIGVRTFDSVFDRIELSQIGQVKTFIQQFDGYIYSPAIEATWQRSRKGFTTMATVGFWKNFSPNVVPNVMQNSLEQKEPSLGLYGNLTANWVQAKPKKDAQGRVVQINNQLTTAQLSWNSSSDRNNPIYLNLSHSFMHQTSSLSYLGTLGFFAARHEQQLDSIIFIRNQLSLPSGLELINSMEFGDRTFFLIEGVQPISPRWSVGAYYQNFTTDLGGLSRQVGQEYGLIFKHHPPRGLAWQARIKQNTNQWELQLQGRWRF
ncbi:MAG: hypothetical protein VKJ24_18590 [Synechococcales bacterium]|nr:hypothetical protein [Synechococcales bacterium]